MIDFLEGPNLVRVVEDGTVSTGSSSSGGTTIISKDGTVTH